MIRRPDRRQHPPDAEQPHASSHVDDPIAELAAEAKVSSVPTRVAAPGYAFQARVLGWTTIENERPARHTARSRFPPRVDAPLFGPTPAGPGWPEPAPNRSGVVLIVPALRGWPNGCRLSVCSNRTVVRVCADDPRITSLLPAYIEVESPRRIADGPSACV